MSRARVNLISTAVTAGCLLVGFGASAWAYGTMTSNPPPARVTHVDAGPALPLPPTTVAPAPVPVPEPVTSPSSHPVNVPQVAAPARVAPNPTPNPTVNPTVNQPPELGDTQVGSAAVLTQPDAPCPTDGREFPYGTCVLPAGVHDSGADIVPGTNQPVATPGAPSKLIVACGETLLVPAAYTVAADVECQAVAR